MPPLKKLFNVYIFGNLHVALASFSLTKLSLLTQQNSDNIIPFFVFFATILSYNYIRLMRINTIKSELYNEINRWRIYLILISIFALTACAFLIVKIRWQALISLMPFALLTGFYVLPPSISSKMTLRSLPGFKIFVIAFTWAGITVLFPLSQYDMVDATIFWLFFQRFLFLIAFTWAGITVLFPLSQYDMVDASIFWLFFQRFLFLIVLTIPFDIRDVAYDSETLKTLPIWLGIKNAKVLGFIVLGLYLAISIFILKPVYQGIEIFIALCLGVLLLKSSTNRSYNYYAFWIEGIPILWLILYHIFA